MAQEYTPDMTSRAITAPGKYFSFAWNVQLRVGEPHPSGNPAVTLLTVFTCQLTPVPYYSYVWCQSIHGIIVHTVRGVRWTMQGSELNCLIWSVNLMLACCSTLLTVFTCLLTHTPHVCHTWNYIFMCTVYGMHCTMWEICPKRTVTLKVWILSSPCSTLFICLLTKIEGWQCQNTKEQNAVMVVYRQDMQQS